LLASHFAKFVRRNSERGLIGKNAPDDGGVIILRRSIAPFNLKQRPVCGLKTP